MTDDKKAVLLEVIKDKDDYYATHQLAIKDALKHAHKILSDKERVALYAKLIEKEGLKKSFLTEDLSVLQRAYVKSFKHFKSALALPLLFVFGFDKKDDLPVGKTADMLSLKDFLEIIERCSAIKGAAGILRRKQLFADWSKKNAIPSRILDCFRHLGYIDTKTSKALKGDVDPRVFLPFLYILLLNTKTKPIVEKQLKAQTFQIPNRDALESDLQLLLKDSGLSV